jgi:hypothetical protein
MTISQNKKINIIKDTSTYGERYQIELETDDLSLSDCFMIGRQDSYGGFDVAYWGIPDFKMYSKSRCRSLIAKIRKIKATNFQDLKNKIRLTIKEFLKQPLKN